MKRAVLAISALVLAGCILYACTTVPLTGRQQLKLISSSEMMAMSYQQYDQFLKENKKSTNQQQTAMVRRCGQRIRKAVETYFAQNNLSAHLNGYNWEFNLVENPQVNAWCMPGGKVVVYTGILPISQNETGLAVVMGHEIAHAVAEHGSERMSQQMLAQLGGSALSVVLQEKPQETQALWMTVYGVGAQLGALLPYSRLQESEADHLGLIFMAMAGYDPRAAISFWQRMAAQKGGQAPPEFLSTHPSDKTRIAKLNQLMPDALKYYKKQ